MILRVSKKIICLFCHRSEIKDQTHKLIKKYNMKNFDL